jgi:diacylglycerol kinase family enzyme
MNGSPSTPPRRLLLIANPISGGGKGRTLAPQLAVALQRHGVQAELFLTSRAGDATARAAAAGDEAWHGVVAIGGDGTVNEVLNGLREPLPGLGVLPVGTANVLAHELRLPRRPEAVAAMLAAGHVQEVAIGRAAGRRFLLFCGVGVDGAVVQRLTAVRTGTLGKHRWLGPIWHTLRHWPRFDLAVTFADGSRLEGLRSVLVSRVRNFGGIASLTADIDIGDGLLHVLCFRQRSRLAWLWQGVRATCGRMRSGRDLVVQATTAVRIDGRAPFQIDGDFGGTSPVVIDLEPVRVRLFVPGDPR